MDGGPVPGVWGLSSVGFESAGAVFHQMLPRRMRQPEMRAGASPPGGVVPACFCCKSWWWFRSTQPRGVLDRSSVSGWGDVDNILALRRKWLVVDEMLICGFEVLGSLGKNVPRYRVSCQILYP